MTYEQSELGGLTARLIVEERLVTPSWAPIVSSTLAVVASLAIAAVLFAFVGVSPVAAFYYIFLGSFANVSNFTEILVILAPLSLASMCMLISLKANFFNVGAEGQIITGAIVATGIGLTLGNSYGATTIPIILLASFAGGAGLSALCAVLKTRFQANEVITTLMMNYIMVLFISYLIHGPWRDPSGWPYSPLLSISAQLPILIPTTRFHIGFLIALVAAVAVYVLMQKSVLGFKIKVSGANPSAAYSRGIKTNRIFLIAAIVAGGLAGWAGAIEVTGVHHRLISGVSANYGYTGIVVALVGRLNVLGVILASVFFSILRNGLEIMQTKTGSPSGITSAVEGLTLVLVIAVEILNQYSIKWVRE